METKNVAEKNDFIYYLNILITVVIMFGFRFLPAPAPMTPHGMAVVGVFLGMVYGWTVSKNGLIWVSVLGLVAAGTTDYGTCSKALGALFASDTIGLLILGMFMLGPIMQCDVGEWLMVKLMSSKLIKGKPWMFNILVCVGTGLVAKVSSSIVVVLLLLGLFSQVFEKAGYKKGDKYPTLLVIGLFTSVLLSTAMFPFKGFGLYVTSAVTKATGGVTVDYAGYLVISIALYFIYTFGYVALMWLLRCDVSGIKQLDISDLEEKHKGGLKKVQKVILALICFWMFGSIAIVFAAGNEGIRLIFKNVGVYGVTLITIALLMIVKVDGKNIATPKSIASSVQWDTVFVMAAGMFAASLLTAEGTGVVPLINQIVGPFLAGRSEVVFLVLLIVIGLALTNLFNNMTVMFILVAVLGSMYQGGTLTNIYAAAVILSMVCILGFYTPASSGFGAMMHGADFVTSGSIYKWGFIVLVYIIVVFSLVIIPLSYVVF